MKKNSDSVPSKSKAKRSSPFFFKLFLPMLMLTVLQLGAFIGVLYMGGEFSYIKEYAYNIFIEKTENRKGYVENLLTQKTSMVYETAEEVNEIVSDILEEENTTINALSTDKGLNKKIISRTADSLIYLLRRDAINDAFIILDTGNLYSENGLEKKAGMYIRDLDETENTIADNQDLLIEMGSSEIASELGIALDFEWSAHLDVTDNSSNQMDFYYNTIDSAKNNPDTPLYNLGYWSGFSRISRSAHKSMKYTLPLIAEDGTVYGIVGIGLMEKTVLKSIPSNDLLSQNACYILGADFDDDDDYSVLIHSGSVFERLFEDEDEINRDVKLGNGLYNFSSSEELQTIGNIQDMNLYNKGSPFKNQKWALISIADNDKILSIYNGLINMLIISSVISLILSMVFGLFINRRITVPVVKMIKKLNSNNNTGEIVDFKSSGIIEIDRLGKAITDLQINVKEYSSRVSKIISMADMGIGVFMYDFMTDTVFMGESLIKLFEFDAFAQEDTVIPFENFKGYLSDIDTENKICNNSIFDKSEQAKNISVSEEIFYNDEKNKISKWFNFSLTRDNGNVIGLVQDITKEVIEKKKIEYERDYDITTGLLNRRAYYNTIEKIFESPENLKISAFLMIDLDNLKYVNDTYGHDFGDDYIKTAANVFKSFRDYGAVVARMSGDEFNVFLSGFDSKEQIRDVINTVRERLVNSYCILADGTHYKIRASGGISWYPDDSKSYEQLIKYADFAMYTIKHSTKGNIAEFDINLYKQDSILITGVEEMNKLIDEQGIRYAFQSIVNAKNGEVIGYEALMRPQSNILKSPMEFIRIAKTGAKLHEIERLTWRLSLKAFQSHIDSGSIPKNSKIFINSLSNCIISKRDILYIERQYRNLLSNIVCEVVESEKDNNKYTEDKQKLVEKWNAKIALDDFGSGYNNEYSLIKSNPYIIKIDSSIISGCDRDISRQNIINNLIQIAKTKNILVLAEGVETYNEMKTVIECGVDFIQGYYLNRPMFDIKPLDEKVVNEIIELNS